MMMLHHFMCWHNTGRKVTAAHSDTLRFRTGVLCQETGCERSSSSRKHKDAAQRMADVYRIYCCSVTYRCLALYLLYFHCIAAIIPECATGILSQEQQPAAKTAD